MAADLKVVAAEYYAKGLNIVPIHLEPFKPGTIEPLDESKHKLPMLPWKVWIERRQTKEEFDSIIFDNYVNGFGVILGQKLPNGQYLGVVDHDTKKLSPEIVSKGSEILKTFRTTAMDRTASGGIHLIFYSAQPLHTIGDYHDTCALELLGERKLCIMAPSFGYSRLNDNLPSEVPDLEGMFYQILDKNGIMIERETERREEQAQLALFKIDKLVDLSKLHKIGENEYQGPHPYHDSTTEKNFSINTQTNSFYCFRHNSGGGPLQLLAIREGVLSCEDAKKGALKGAKYRKVFQLAIAEGLIDEKRLDQVEINPVLIAQDIMLEHKFVVEDESDTLFVFEEQEGIYTDKTERLIKREITKYLNENDRARYYVDVENHIKHSPETPIRKLQATPELLAVANGILNVLTRELKPFNSEYFITSKLKVTYNPSAKCPAIEKFLSEVLDKDDRETTQEFVGFCLYKEYIYHKALLGIGAGGNGKTVFQNLNLALLADENVTNQSIQNLCNSPYGLGELFGKLANICDDLPSKTLKNTGNFKQATGNGRIGGRHIYKGPFYFVNFAKLMFNCNRVPPIVTEEDNIAYWRRFLPIHFNHAFTGEKCQCGKIHDVDKRLLEKLTTKDELEGYLNYALDGLKRLWDKQGFTERQSISEVRTELIMLSDSTRAFVEQCIQVTNEYNDFLLTDDIYRDFIKFCVDHKIPNKPKGEVTKAMQQCNGAIETKIRLDGRKSNPRPAWRYVKRVQCVQDVQPLQNRTLVENSDVENRYDGGVSESCTSCTPSTREPLFASCYFCQKPIFEEDWRADEFSANKPCHRECYNHQQDLLKKGAPT